MYNVLGRIKRIDACYLQEIPALLEFKFAPLPRCNHTVARVVSREATLYMRATGQMCGNVNTC